MHIVPGPHDDVRVRAAASLQQRAEAEYGLVPDQVCTVFWGLVAAGLIGAAALGGGWFHGVAGVIGGIVLGSAATFASITAVVSSASLLGGTLSRVAAVSAGAAAGAMVSLRDQPLDPWEPYAAVGLGVVAAGVASFAYREHLAREYGVDRWRVTMFGLLVRVSYACVAAAAVGAALAAG